ncbi:MAG: 3-hydroxyacyl-[acyl-carrier-protein] dehydratase [Pseudomonadota bacterium]|nr:3-hydroxyacyl-[acyl-carrier-protein] dehydratase [Pseudomonadota bacterium]
MSDAGYHYPIVLDRVGIEALIPHRGAISACQQLTIDTPHDYRGTARWSLDNPIIEGHFPGMPIVPGVMLIEAMAQLAGAGVLRGDPYVKTLPSDSVGVLAGVRNCWFKGPVLPDTDVSFHIHCRQMAPVLVQVNARIEVADVEVAKLDVVIAYAPREQLFAVPA